MNVSSENDAQQIEQNIISIKNDVNIQPDEEYFKVIGSEKRLKTKKVKPVLPKWMYNCNKFDGNIDTNCCELEIFNHLIDQRLLNNLLKDNITKLFPVQKTIIPYLLDCFQKLKFCQQRDVCVLSPTGSGKTLAFAVPIVNYLLQRMVTQIRALVILPVSDLANQVYNVFETLCKNSTIRIGLATGSSKKTQNISSTFYRKRADNSGYICLVDILIATPGKLIDLIQQDNGFHLKHLEILVVDEVDRMMNETQLQWLREIECSVFESNTKHICCCSMNSNVSSNFVYNVDAYCPCSISSSPMLGKFLHKILLSATLTTDPEKIDRLCLYHPILFNVSTESQTNSIQHLEQTTPSNLKEYIVIIDKNKKPLAIWHLIKTLKYSRILCFTDSVDSTHRLHRLMKQLPEIKVCEFSSRKNLKKRMKILNQFENGAVNMIISTDIFARGMDINGIDCVISYDLPRNETAYIHRIGRTARAGHKGTAISLITPDQLSHFTIISRRVHKNEKKQIERLNIKDSDLKPIIPQYQKALKVLEKEVIMEERLYDMRKKKQIIRSKFSKKSTRNNS